MDAEPAPRPSADPARRGIAGTDGATHADPTPSEREAAFEAARPTPRASAPQSAPESAGQGARELRDITQAIGWARWALQRGHPGAAEEILGNAMPPLELLAARLDALALTAADTGEDADPGR